MRFLPFRPCFSEQARNPIRASGRDIRGQRSRPRGGCRKSKCRILCRLPLQPRNFQRPRFPIENKSFQHSGHLRRLPHCYQDGLHRQHSRAGRRARFARCSGVHRLPWRAHNSRVQRGQSTVNPARLSLLTCGRCHADARLAARYNLPADKVPTFADSFHGLAARGGSQTVANCSSCHGVHNIFPPRILVPPFIRRTWRVPAEIVIRAPAAPLPSAPSM